MLRRMGPTRRCNPRPQRWRFWVYAALLLAISACFIRRDDRYVSALAGLNVRTGPSQQAPVVALLPYRLQVSVLEEAPAYEDIAGVKGKWTRIKCTEAPQCWVFGAYLDYDQPRLFYRVEAAAGLNLRTAPTVKSNIVSGLPYRTIGFVEAVAPRVETIEEKSGFWFRTTFQGQSGWIFSGFTTTSSNESELTGDYIYDPEIKDLPELKDPAWKDGRIRRMVTAGGFSIQEMEYPAVHDALISAKRSNYTGSSVDYCSGPESRVVFVHKLTGRAYSAGGYAEWIERVDVPIPGIVQTSGHGCWCCCPYPVSRQYLIEEDRVTTIDLYMFQNETAACEFSNGLFGEKIWSTVDARLNGNTILIHWKKPACVMSEAQLSEKMAGKTVHFDNVRTFAHRTFIRLEKTEHGYRLKKKFETDVPEEFLGEWNSAKRIEPVPRTERIEEVSAHPH